MGFHGKICVGSGRRNTFTKLAGHSFFVQIGSDPTNGLKAAAVSLEPKFHWELSKKSRLFSATAFQGRLFPSGRLRRAVRLLEQERVSSYSFQAAKSGALQNHWERDMALDIG
jgi:hypothetical protein